jgi:hypothetical protein
MQWPLTSQSHGSASQREQLVIHVTDQTPRSTQQMVVLVFGAEDGSEEDHRQAAQVSAAEEGEAEVGEPSEEGAQVTFPFQAFATCTFT